MSESDVGRVQRYFPDAQCGCVGSVVIEAEPKCRHQVFDFPEVGYSLIEHRLYAGHSSGGGKHHAAQTTSFVPSGKVGPNLIALIAHLSGLYHPSIRQIQGYLQEHWQLPFSLKTISKAKTKTTNALADPYRQIGEHVRSQPLAHADETRHFCATKCHWLWTMVVQ